jgi:glycosyltransferase involved in cell wall biosynthesis
MTEPLFSIVIPAYNAARTLEATVRSALAQTVKDLEIIIVDDGSKDATLEVARSLESPTVRVISQPNGGAASARNTGIRAARGKYVALLDADDLWLPHKLERQLEVLENKPGVYAVQCGASHVNDAMEVLHVRRCFPPKDVLLETLLFQNLPAFLSALVVARDKLNEVGGFDTSLEILEEWDMAIKMARYCNMDALEEPLVLYRVHPGNRSRNLDIHIKPGHLVLNRLFADPDLPPRIRARKRLIYARFFTMLSGGAFQRRRWWECVKWGVKALVTHPACAAYMAALPVRRFRRWRSRRAAAAS